MIQLAKTIRTKLIELSDEHTKNSTQRFFKEKVKTHGVKSKNVGVVAKWATTQTKDMSKAEVFSLAEELFKSGYCEEAWLAGDLVHDKRNLFVETDIEIFSKWIDTYIDDWAKCDTFCNHSVGALIEMYPNLVGHLKKWAKSPNRWMKRAAAVSLIVPAKKGLFLKEAFGLADILLLDTDDMVQKGYGWLLKEESRKHQKEVFDYVMQHKINMPRTALRYAIELMPMDLKKQAMSKA